MGKKNLIKKQIAVNSCKLSICSHSMQLVVVVVVEVVAVVVMC